MKPSLQGQNFDTVGLHITSEQLEELGWAKPSAMLDAALQSPTVFLPAATLRQAEASWEKPPHCLQLQIPDAGTPEASQKADSCLMTNYHITHPSLALSPPILPLLAVHSEAAHRVSSQWPLNVCNSTAASPALPFTKGCDKWGEPHSVQGNSTQLPPDKRSCCRAKRKASQEPSRSLRASQKRSGIGRFQGSKAATPWLFDQLQQLSSEGMKSSYEAILETELALINHYVLFALLEPLALDLGHISYVIPPGLHVGRVVQRLGNIHLEDICPTECREAHNFHYVEALAISATHMSATMEIKVDLHRQLCLPTMKSFLSLSKEELQDAWVLLQPFKDEKRAQEEEGSKAFWKPPRPYSASAVGSANGWAVPDASFFRQAIRAEGPRLGSALATPKPARRVPSIDADAACYAKGYPLAFGRGLTQRPTAGLQVSGEKKRAVYT